MKRTTFIPPLLVFALAVLFQVQAKCQSEEIPMISEARVRPLAPDVIEDVWDLLGVRIAYFVYEAPFKHQITLALVEYRKGKLQKPQFEIPVQMDSGKQTIILYYYHSENKDEFFIASHQGPPGPESENRYLSIKLKGNLYHQGHYVTLGNVSMKGLKGRCFGISKEGEKLILSKEVRLFNLAATKVEGCPNYDESKSLDVIAAKYDLFVAVTALLEMK